jgi:hypothetical protein
MTLLGMLSQKNKVLSSMTVRKKDSGGVIANGGDVAITHSQQPQTPIIVRNISSLMPVAWPREVPQNIVNRVLDLEQSHATEFDQLKALVEKYKQREQVAC